MSRLFRYEVMRVEMAWHFRFFLFFAVFVLYCGMSHDVKSRALSRGFGLYFVYLAPNMMFVDVHLMRMSSMASRSRLETSWHSEQQFRGHADVSGGPETDQSFDPLDSER